MEDNTIKQVRNGVWVWVAIVLCSGIPIAAVALLHYWKGTPTGEFMRDPIATGGLPFYTGFFSQIGFFFWGMAAGACAVGVMLARKITHTYSALCRLVFATGVLTVILGLDDGLLLHEKAFPKFGISEKVVLLCYIGMMLVYLLGFSRVILTTRYSLLASALFAFALSAGVDIFVPSRTPIYLLEDAAKLVGITSWLAYCLMIAAQASGASLSPGVGPGVGETNT